jgi:dynein intermediate chain 1
LLTFDIANVVGDVAWSPYSSTVFAAVASDGKVHVFDLFENKHDPLCVQRIVKRAKLTKVRFNSQDYIIVVGDDKGGVNSLKLSPNLRKIHVETLDKMDKGTGNVEGGKPVMLPTLTQKEKMEVLLSSLDTKIPS